MASIGRGGQPARAVAGVQHDARQRNESLAASATLSKADRVLMGHLYAYLTENEEVLREYLSSAGKDKSGKRRRDKALEVSLDDAV